MRLAFAAAALLFLRALPAGAASSSRLAVDPRVELLGVVRHLAADGPDSGLDAAYQRDVERRFGALRGHPVVKLYKQAVSRPGGEGLGIVMLYYTAPPELKLARPALRVPYVETEADKQFVQRFLWELRDFAAVSGFASFWGEHLAFYRKIEESAAAELAGLDPAAAIERYLRVSLDCRNNYVLSPLYKVGRFNSFILPYPDPVTFLERPKEPFEVYTLLSWVPKKADRGPWRNSIFDVPSDILWHEALYVFVDPSFHHYEARYVPEPAKLYGEAAGCRTNDINCLKSYVVAALSDRLGYGVWQFERNDAAPYPRALSARLEEYEAGGGTLWEFYPRLFGVFAELAHPGAPAATLPVPARPVAAASDFFDPRWRKAFSEAP